MRRFECLQALSKYVTDETIVVCNLQDTTYEWNHVRPNDANLLRVGMGLVTPVATGLAMALPGRKVVSLDGDGGVTLNLGVVTTLGKYRCRNLLVIVFDNELYNSAGVIPSPTGSNADLAAIAKAAGIINSTTVRKLEEFNDAVQNAMKSDQLWFIVAKVEKIPTDVPRPTMDAHENKYRFIRFVERLEGTTILPAEEQKSFF